uniref:Uncharacterized protein LOC111122632 isoform X2 n=1 Tax=Crassostrea virginica TaxID=6565 RepID=A0A8B8CY75_CRAVI|nr:uncharacterized protein LOC111122632 isoform X2 [Crassostrea virginica]
MDLASIRPPYSRLRVTKLHGRNVKSYELDVACGVPYEMVCRQTVTMLIILALLLCPCVSSEVVGKCPRTKAEWERESALLHCQEPYHCVRDDKGHLLQICTQKIWIPKGMCPEYNYQVANIDVTKCASPTCPESFYWSNTVYLYPVCYGPERELTPQVPKPTSQITGKPEVVVTSDYQTNTTLKKRGIDNDITGSLRSPGWERSTSLIVGVSIAGALVVLIAAVTLVYFCRKRKRHNRCKRTGTSICVEEENELHENQAHLDVESKDLQRFLYVQGKGLQGNPPHHDDIQSEEPQGNPPHHDDIQSEEPQGNPPHHDDKQSEEPHGNPPHHDDIQIYIPGGPGTGSQFNDSTRILVLVTSSSEITKHMEEAARATFGRKYIYCQTLALFLERMHEQETTYLWDDFHLNTSDVEAILRKLRDVVSVTSIPFVVTVPLDLWSSNRKKCTSIIDKHVVFKTQYI